MGNCSWRIKQINNMQEEFHARCRPNWWAFTGMIASVSITLLLFMSNI